MVFVAWRRYDDRDYVPRPDSFCGDERGDRDDYGGGGGGGGSGRGKVRRGSGSGEAGGRRAPRSAGAQPKSSSSRGDGARETSTAKSGPAGGATVSSSSPAMPDERPSDQNPQAVANAKVPAPVAQIMRMVSCWSPFHCVSLVLPLVCLRQMGYSYSTSPFTKGGSTSFTYQLASSSIIA